MKTPAESSRPPAAILPAAGASSRLGRPKQLIRLGGDSLVRRAACLSLNAGLEHIIVVTGCEAGAVERELGDLPVTVCRNPDWEKGMGHSIACGAARVPAEVDGVMIQLCDQWRLDEEDLERLVRAWFTDISHIVAATWKIGDSSVYGPPVVFPRHIIPELKRMNGYAGARHLLDEHQDITKFIGLENARFDLDEPQDLELMRKLSVTATAGLPGS